MNLGQRIKKVRKYYNLSQEKFGARIGVQQGTVASYENGARTPIDAIIQSICREFDVNENWLKTGDGEMFASVSGNPLDDILKKYHLSEVEQFIIKKYLQLDEGTKKIFTAELKKIFDEWQASTAKEEPPKEQESKIATLEHQVQELTELNRELMERMEAIEQEDAEKEQVNQTISSDTRSL